MRTLKTITVSVSILLTNLCFSHENNTSANAESSIAFIQNNGQWSAHVLYKAGVGHGATFIERHAFTHVQMHAGDVEKRHDLMHDDPEQFKQFAVRGHAWKTNFVGANPLVAITPLEKRSEYHNYFLGNDTTKWAGHVPLFNEVMYHNLYHNIHLRAYSHEANFKYDFIVQAGTDPSIIAMEYDGVDAMQLQNNHLLLQTSVGDFKELAPYAYQVIDGAEVEVRCNYVLEGTTVRFSFPSGYDRTVDLIIDPVLIAATLSGTTGSENYGHCATYDNDGNIYTGAISFGVGYPVTTGAFQTNYVNSGFSDSDIAISKLTPDGTNLIYATYLGGDLSEFPYSMFVSDADELYLLGTSNSTDFPTSAGAYDNTLDIGGSYFTDFVITHFTSDATNIIGSTYVGGDDFDALNSFSLTLSDEFRGEIIVDGAGNCYVAGSTNSNNFPVTTGAYQTTHGGGQDGVVFKMPPDLSTLTWSTYLGGTGEDAGFGLRLDGGGNLYVCGTTSAGFFTGTGYQTAFQGGAADGYVLQLSANGSTVMNSSYWGTAEGDYAYFVDIDLDGDIYLFGQNGNGAPVTAGVYSNAGSRQFISKLDAGLNALQYSTVIGSGSGSTDFVPIAFMVDHCEYVYFSGHSSNGPNPSPTTPGALQTSGGFYLGVLEPDATGLNYATYYGGITDHVDGGTSRFDPSGVINQAVCSNSGFYTTPGAWSDTYPGGYDIGVFKIDLEVSLLDVAAAATPSATGCAPFTVTFDNTSDGTDFIWDFDDGSPPNNSFEPTHTFTTPGVYDVRLIAIDSMACVITDTTYLTITVDNAPPVSAAFNHTLDCAAMTVDAQNTGTANVVYDWNMGDGTTYTTENVTHTYGATGTYTITFVVTDTICGSTDTGSTVITIAPDVLADIAVSPVTIGCAPFTVDFTNNSNGVTYSWNFDDGSPIDNTVQPTHTFTSIGTYDVMLVAIDSSTCNIADTTYLTITVDNGAPVTAAFNHTLDCAAMTVDAQNTGTANAVYSWNMGDGTTYTTENVTHTYGATGTYTITFVVTDTICGSTDTGSTVITIAPDVLADIAVSPGTIGCAPFTVDFTNNSNGVTYSWNFDDGSPIDNTVQPTHTFTSIGNYDVMLVAIDSSTCNIADTTYLTITVDNGAPVTASFNHTVNCATMTVDAQNTGTANAVYDWDMGDGMTYTTENVTHTYGATGTYTITFVITDTICGNTDTGSTVITIAPDVLADIAATPDTMGCVPFTVDFTNNSNGVTYSWNFDDGSPLDNAVQPTHTFTSVGTYDVMLVAVDSASCNIADTTYLTITVGNGIPVTASFSYTLDCATMTVNAQNTGTANAGYSWDMGDGTTYTTENVTHAYGALGNYTITFVTIDTICGNTDTITTVVTIAPEVFADIAASPDTMRCVPFTVDFTNNSNGVTYSWNFDDGSPIDNTVQPTHTFTSVGTYNVMFIAIDSASCNIADTTYLTIVGTEPPPVDADFIAVQNANCSLFQIETTNNSTGNNLVYEWNMGDGTTYTDSNVAHQYSGPGTFTITLIATDSVCFSSDITTVTVSLQESMVINLGPDQLICNGVSAMLDAGTSGLTYNWNTQETTQTIETDVVGTYWVVVSDGVCETSDTIQVQMAPDIDLGYVDELCVGQRLVLDPGVPAQSYLWNTGATTQQIEVMLGGEYTFTLVDSLGCIRTDTVTVIESEGSAEVFVPNAFTPNGDGVNDIWYPVGEGIEDFELQIFTRWGELVFTSNSTDVGWDGTFKGRALQNGVYVYKMWYINACVGTDFVQKFGHIVLTR